MKIVKRSIVMPKISESGTGVVQNVVRRAPPLPPALPSVWTDPFQVFQFIRLEGGNFADASSSWQEADPVLGDLQLAPGEGLNGADAFRLGPDTGYLEINAPGNMSGALAYTLEMTFKPLDPNNWVVCGQTDTQDQVLGIMCVNGVIHVGVGDFVDSSDWWFSIALADLPPEVLRPTAKSPLIFWHIAVSSTCTSEGRVIDLKLNGYSISTYRGVVNEVFLPNRLRIGGTSVLMWGSEPPPTILVNEFRIKTGRSQYGARRPGLEPLFNRYRFNTERWTNSSGKGSGWDRLTSKRSNYSEEPQPELEFFDGNRTVSTGFSSATAVPTDVGSQGFGSVAHINGGGKRYFEVIVNWLSNNVIFGLIAGPEHMVLDQDTPFAEFLGPGQFYLAEVYEDGTGGAGLYDALLPVDSTYGDQFRDVAGGEVPGANDTFGFYVDLTTRRIDKIVRNGIILDGVGSDLRRIKDIRWMEGWKVVPFYNVLPNLTGASLTLVTAGDFRFPPQGIDTVYQPWEAP